MQKMVPAPKDLIQRWQDYCFMHLYEHSQYRITSNLLEASNKLGSEITNSEVLTPSLHVIHAVQDRFICDSGVTLKACRKLLLQSPDLIRILQVGRLLLIPDTSSDAASIQTLDIDFTYSTKIFRIHILLDLSWNDIQKCICSLRPLANKDSKLFYTLFLCLPTLCWKLNSLYPKALVSRDLACRFIQVMQQIENQDLPLAFW
jgi:hypothetical protein